MKRLFCAFLALFVVLTVVCPSMFAAEPPAIVAKGAIVAEKTTGTILFEQDADARLYPASLTKIMTGILALELCSDTNGIITVSARATEPLPAMGSSVYLIPGEQMAFMDMMRYMLIASGNDAANAIAEYTGGTIADFVDLMNEKAEALGCTNTHFDNPHGLHSEAHYTSARDMLIISEYAMENETFAQIVSETSVTLPVTNKHAKTTLKYTTNHLLSRNAAAGYVYKGAFGIKTGSTTPAGLCLSSAFEKDGLQYYCVVLGSSKDAEGKLGNFLATIDLFNYASKNFSMQMMLKTTQPVVEVPVTLSSEGSSVILLPERSISALLPNDFNFSDVSLTYDVPESLEAPIAKGQSVGTLKVEYKGQTYDEMSLLASSELPRSQVLKTISKFRQFIESTAFKLLIGGIVLALIIIAVIILSSSRGRRKTGRYGKDRYSR